MRAERVPGALLALAALPCYQGIYIRRGVRPANLDRGRPNEGWRSCIQHYPTGEKRTAPSCTEWFVELESGHTPTAPDFRFQLCKLTMKRGVIDPAGQGRG
jgi:hypothetical protein